MSLRRDGIISISARAWVTTRIVTRKLACAPRAKPEGPGQLPSGNPSGAQARALSLLSQENTS